MLHRGPFPPFPLLPPCTFLSRLPEINSLSLKFTRVSLCQLQPRTQTEEPVTLSSPPRLSPHVVDISQVFLLPSTFEYSLCVWGIPCLVFHSPKVEVRKLGRRYVSQAQLTRVSEVSNCEWRKSVRRQRPHGTQLVMEETEASDLGSAGEDAPVSGDQCWQYEMHCPGPGMVAFTDLVREMVCVACTLGSLVLLEVP